MITAIDPVEKVVTLRLSGKDLERLRFISRLNFTLPKTLAEYSWRHGHTQDWKAFLNRLRLALVGGQQ